MRRTRRRPETAADRLDLSLGIRDFGPVAEGDVTLSPLTVLVGPNNAGKSYTAMLLDAVFGTYLNPYRFAYRSTRYHTRVPGRMLFEQMRLFDDGDAWRVDQSQVARLVEQMLKLVYEENFQHELTRLFSSELGGLLRHGRASSLLKITSQGSAVGLTLGRQGVQVSSLPTHQHQVSIALADEAGGSMDPEDVGVVEVEGGLELTIPRSLQRVVPKEAMEDLMGQALHEAVYKMLFRGLSRECYYLPAARSGILQGHKALAGSIVQRAPLVGLQDLDIPRLSGVVADFIASMLELRTWEQTSLAQIAETMERELISGRVLLTQNDRTTYPEIEYSVGETRIPLHRASSTVSELAPLFLYLKHLVVPGDILIIEEPEAHLHPVNQIRLAKLLVRLVRAGLNLVITTHSEFLLQQLSLYVQLGTVRQRGLPGLADYDSGDYLQADEVAAYVFRYDESAAGYITVPLEVAPDEGISQEEFSFVDQVMYEDAYNIEGRLGTNV